MVEAIALMLSIAISSLASASSVTIKGVATYRPRIAIPPDAVLRVTLEDVSRADAPAGTVVGAEFATNGRQVPLPFSLQVDQDQIQPGHRYSVRAAILVAGQLAWTSDQANTVKADGTDPDLSINLVQVKRASANGSPTFEGTTWELAELGGVPSANGESRRPHVKFSDPSQVSGFSGVNQFSGTYRRSRYDLKVGPLAMTMMAGPPELMELEQRFANALSQATSAKVFRDWLVLYRNGEVSAKLKAQAARPTEPK